MDCVPLRFYCLGYSATGLSNAQSHCVFKECMKPFVFCVTSLYTLELGCRSTSWNLRSVARHLMSPTRTSAVVLFSSSFWLDDCSFMCTSLEMWCLHSAQLSEIGCCFRQPFLCHHLFFSAVYNNHSVTLETCFFHHLKHSCFFTLQSAHKLNWMSSRCRALVYIIKHAFYCHSLQPSLKGSPATVRIKLPLHIKHKCYSCRNHVTHSRVLSAPYLAFPWNEMLYIYYIHIFTWWWNEPLPKSCLSRPLSV